MTSPGKSSRNHHGLYLYPTMECGFVKMDHLGSRMIGSETITDSKKSSVGSRVGIGSTVESKSKNLI